MSVVQVYEGDFGTGSGRGSAKLRRLSKRRLKKWLARALRAVWESAK